MQRRVFGKRLLTTWAVGVVTGLAAGCAGGSTSDVILATNRPAAPPVDANVDAVLYLVGDAGKAYHDDPHLLDLQADIARTARLQVPTAVVFLGDNIYNDGLHPPDHGYYLRDLERLDAQVNVVRSTGVPAYFIPGNHDWASSGPDGTAALARQEHQLDATSASELGTQVELVPRRGCPGPHTKLLGSSVNLVFLDTEWLLRSQPKPTGPPCSFHDQQQVMDGLRSALNARGERRTIVLGHHPLLSRGPHGGYFTFTEHLFPLRKLHDALWIPLPLVGSLYPAARNSGITDQDFSGSGNQAMRAALSDVFDDFPGEPFIFAAGHDHSLQIMRGAEAGVEWALTSGAGSKLSAVDHDPAMEFAASRYGYMRLVFREPDGKATVTVVSFAGGRPDVWTRDLN